ncbi:Uncharacterised protein g7100 [Pycnogonum litorale]
MLKYVTSKLSRSYFLYELNTGVYMLEPWEKLFFNSIVVGIMAMSVYTSYVYMPRYTRSVLAYFDYLDADDA